MQNQPIKAILRIIRPRIYSGEGAFYYTDTATGRTVQAKNYCPNNLRGITRELNNGNWEGSNEPRTYVTEEELPVREFNRLVKDWDEVGSDAETAASYIRTMLEKDTERV
jgi:hypothetical protein